MKKSLFLAAVMIAAGLAVRTARAGVAEADAFYKGGKWVEAREEYMKALPSLEGDERARVLSAIGYCYIRDQKHLEEAIETYRQVVAMKGIDPQIRAAARLKVGYCLNMQQKYQEGLDELSQIPAMEGAHPNVKAEAIIYSATSAVKLGEDERSIEILDGLSKIEGAADYYYVTALLSSGSRLQKLKRYDEAIERYRAALEHPGMTGHQKGWAEGYVAELEALEAGDNPFYIKPYVRWEAPAVARVFWVSLGELPAGSVTVTDPVGKSLSADAEVTPLRETTCFRHIATFSSLAQGTRYRYRAECGGKTIEGSFRTAPDRDAEVTFAAIGDTQAAPDLHELVGKAIAKDHPDFVLHVGDLTDKGSIWGKWRYELFDPGWTYMQNSLFIPTVGNHDGGHFFPDLFDMRPLYYGFDYGNVHVTVLDSYWSGGSEKPAQMKWLENDLKSTTAEWKIVSTHVPMVASREETPWWGKDDYLPILEKYGVDVIVVGHHPMYRRYLPIGRKGTKPIINITTGGGGPVGPPVPSPILVKGAGVNFHTFYRVDGDTLEIIARLPDGTELDHLTLHKKDGKYQPEIMNAAVDPDLGSAIRYLYHDLVTDRTCVLMVDMDSAPQPGKPVKIAIDTTALPRGPLRRDELPPDASLVISQKEGSPWKIATQEQSLDQDRLVFEVTAPDNVKVGGGNVNPPLGLTLTLKVGDRLFEPFSPPVQLTSRSALSLSQAQGEVPLKWHFRFDPDKRGDAEKWYGASVDLSKWQTLSINDWWERQADPEYDGVAWYRTEAQAPKVPAGDVLWLDFGAIDESCWVYVNGQEAGHQIYDSKVDDDAWEKPRRFDITKFVKPGAENLFAVKVQDLFGMGGIYKGALLVVEPENILAGGTFGEGMSGWTVVESSAKPMAVEDLVPSRELQVTLRNGKYVEERALCVESRDTQPVHLTHVYPPLPGEGDYRFSVRMRQRLLPGGVDPIAPVTVNLGTEGEAGASLAAIESGSGNYSDWVELSQPFTVAADAAKNDLRLSLIVANPGIYEFDEIRITRKG